VRTVGSDTTMVRLVVADDCLPFLEGVARGLPARGPFSVVACCTDGRAAVAAISEHRPDVALVDMRMPRLDGRAVVVEVVRLKLDTRVIVYSAHGTLATVRAVLEDGACGFLDKVAEWEEVLAAVRTVAGGGVWVTPRLHPGLKAALASRGRMPSVRELEVLWHASFGLTDAEIAARMYISRETVRTNLKRCSEKLGVSGKLALVAKALRQGLME